ncbi:COMM domain containing 2 [Pelomyxa schiedti]|nr:COMM domain containing 2 [Pelomyxa schiedti]
MPLVSFSEQTKGDLILLAQLKPPHYKEFIRVAVELTKNGASPATNLALRKAAQTAGLADEERVRRATDAAATVLTECAKASVAEADFAEIVASVLQGTGATGGGGATASANAAALGEAAVTEFCGIMGEVYGANKAELRRVLGESSFGLPKYTDLEWRLDVPVATRCQRQLPVQPLYILKLHINNPSAPSPASSSAAASASAASTPSLVNDGPIVLQADPLTISNMCAQLETAISQLKASSTRRVMRNIH